VRDYDHRGPHDRFEAVDSRRLEAHRHSSPWKGVHCGCRQLSAPPARARRVPRVLVGLLIVIVLLLFAARTIASFVVEYRWWQEMNQVSTWLNLMLYEFSPLAVATLFSFALLFSAHALGMKFAGMRLRENSRYAAIVTTVLLLMALMLSAAAIDTWTVVRFFGGRNPPVEATAWRDSVFGLPLGFYLFDLPFYGVLRGFVLLLAIAGAIVY
jgi:uncharacterized protein